MADHLPAPASLGTLGLVAEGFAPGPSLTTPDPVTLHGMLAELARAGIGAAAMEASSHGIEQRRLDGVRLAAAGFTNLTRDHLDYHGDMEAYFAAKRRLFEALPPEAPAAINIDDPRADQLLGIVRRPISYALTREADVWPTSLTLTLVLLLVAGAAAVPVARRAPTPSVGAGPYSVPSPDALLTASAATPPPGSGGRFADVDPVPPPARARRASGWSTV